MRRRARPRKSKLGRRRSSRGGVFISSGSRLARAVTSPFLDRRIAGMTASRAIHDLAPSTPHRMTPANGFAPFAFGASDLLLRSFDRLNRHSPVDQRRDFVYSSRPIPIRPFRCQGAHGAPSRATRPADGSEMRARMKRGAPDVVPAGLCDAARRKCAGRYSIRRRSKASTAWAQDAPSTAPPRSFAVATEKKSDCAPRPAGLGWYLD